MGIMRIPNNLHRVLRLHVKVSLIPLLGRQSPLGALRGNLVGVVAGPAAFLVTSFEHRLHLCQSRRKADVAALDALLGLLTFGQRCVSAGSAQARADAGIACIARRQCSKADGEFRPSRRRCKVTDNNLGKSAVVSKETTAGKLGNGESNGVGLGFLQKCK